MKTNVKTGSLGERLAANYLKRGGYKILGTNFSYPWGEIDIVAKDKDKTLVFVEVKALNKRGQIIVQDSELRPEDNLTELKLIRLKRSCSFFANEHKDLADNGWRIDLVSLTISDKSCDIRHLKSIG